MQEWLDAYGISHQNKTNKAIHWICVPLIFYSILGLLAGIPASSLKELFPIALQPYIHFGTIALVLVLLFYLIHSFTIFIGMTVFSIVCLLVVNWIGSLAMPLWQSSLIIFVAAWIGQFYGHKVEGAKPSFFEDVQFLLIGPAWLLHFIYLNLNIKY
jgi:uncharacterized membrane protein YGL010W